jgi:hypothetical protein
LWIKYTTYNSHTDSSFWLFLTQFLVAPKTLDWIVDRRNCIRGPLLEPNIKKGPLFETLQDWTSFFKLNQPSAPIFTSVSLNRVLKLKKIKRKGKKTEVPLILPLLLSHEPAAPRPEDQTDQLRDLTLSGDGAWRLEASGVDRHSGRAPHVQHSAVAPGDCARFGAAAGPSGVARHGAKPKRVRHGVVCPRRCGLACVRRACGIGAIQNPKVFIFRNKNLFSLFKTQKYHYI